ncbi:MAG TPA: tripartite tricarboxylate transporter substrate binding protein [Ramlibacter sp.]|nr:tripartite tricarboxylate transporter substrate binding protein [Ramlibacter sp.]
MQPESSSRFLPRRAAVFTAASTLVAAALLAALPREVQAQDKFPSRPVTLVVPLAAGGPTDILARRFAIPMSAALKVPVVVTNVPGAGGAIGSKRVMDAPADGYTALIANNGLTSAPTVLSRPDLDPRGRLEPVGMFGSTPVTLTVRSTLPVNSLAEFLKYSRAQASALNMAHSGTGSGGHLNSVLFNSLAQLSPTYVPYQGASPILTALAAGQVDVHLGLSSTDVPFHKAGRARILAVSSRTRLAALPDVPTMAEAGLPEFDASTWFGVLLPRNVPEPVLAAFEAAVVEATKDPAYRAALETDFLSELPAAQHMTRRGFGAFINTEVARWQQLLTGK